MASAAPDPKALYARLKALYPELTSDEKIARELGLETVKTLQRLKAGEGVSFDTAMELLLAAGWLNHDGDEKVNIRAERARLRREAQRLAEVAEQIERNI